MKKIPMPVRFVLLALALPFVAHAQVPLFNQDPRGTVPEEVETFNEQQVTFPTAPKERDLLPFDPEHRTSMKFYVDAASISVGADAVVRYTLVVTGDGETRNVMYEGLRCKTGEKKTYGFGQRDDTWSKARDPQWESIRYDVPRLTLARNFLCPLKGPIQTAKEGVEALRNGIHPQVQQFKPN